MFAALRADPIQRAAVRAYDHVVAQSRRPGFFVDVGQRFFDVMFADFDRSLREMGTGDLSVGREVRRMAEAFYGRIAAYESGLAADDKTLQAALARNLFGTAAATLSKLAAMAEYLRREAAHLASQDTGHLLTGEVAFGAPPEIVPEERTT